MKAGHVEHNYTSANRIDGYSEMIQLNSLNDFLKHNNELCKYDQTRTSLGVNPCKLAKVFDDDKHVATIVFIDHLYLDGREIYIPAFDKSFSSTDCLQPRLDTHRFIENEIAKHLNITQVKSFYTDASPNSQMYWDYRISEQGNMEINSSIQNVDNKSSAKEEFQLSLFN